MSTTDYQVEGGETAAGTVESSHDSFVFDRHRNFLVNGAGIGLYAHGRVHQQAGNAVFVGDLIHKRGPLATDDLLLMEEQRLLSGGPPLTVRSSYGRLLAMVLIPEMGNASGEGELVAYYEGGVVTFNTHLAPRETRVDAEGQIVQKGWDQMRQVTYRLNRVSATGRYAVAVLPRDHFFRSVFGLHFLSRSVGEGTIATEQVNLISTDVDPLLKADSPRLLSGAACGFWLHGNRMFATTGMTEDACHGAAPFGRGFVSWNQAVSFTEDGTPLPRWEGLWTFDSGIAGVHWLGDTGIRPEAGAFGFIASGEDEALRYATIDERERVDRRGGEEIPIEWSFETARFSMGFLDRTKKVTQGNFEAICSQATKAVRILIRTDRHDAWEKWHEFRPADKIAAGEQRLLSEPLGTPPKACAEATWFQFRVEGLGAIEDVRSFDLDWAEGSVKTGRRDCVTAGAADKDPFETNTSPAAERWPASK